MRNSASGSTPKTNTVQNDSISKNEEKVSGKKLKQARLPFKIIAPDTSPISSKTITTTTDENKDERKRKLSYDSEDAGVNEVVKEDDNVSKENVDILTALTKKQKLSVTHKNDTNSDCAVSLLDDDDDDVKGNNKDVAHSTIASSAGKRNSVSKTPKATIKDKRKGAGTPQTSSEQKDKNGSATKLQIKLPLIVGKKKRRKSNLNQLPDRSSPTVNLLSNLQQELSSDDIEGIAVELNPQKRKKLNTEYDETNTPETKSTIVQEQESEIIALDSEPEEEEKKSSKTKNLTEALTGKRKFKNDCKKEETNSTYSSERNSPNSKTNITKKPSENDDIQNIQISDSSDDDENNKGDKEDLDESVLSDNDNEADDETDNLAGKSVNISSDVSKTAKSKLNNSKQNFNNKINSVSSSKNLTAKQVKLMEQRRKAREEKERKLQEEKLKKQQEKEEKEIVKKREREEKEEQKRKEREEKDEQKRKEREEKERKRLTEIEAKNEEKRRKTEAKEEELRKKEEERKRKEQEKEEAELKKKKAAQAFTKFFLAKTPTNVQLQNEEDSNTGDGSKLLAFRPFQIKGDMKLAPICRKMFTAEKKTRLDNLLRCNNTDMEENDEKKDGTVQHKPLSKSQLYLSELRSGKILPGKWRRPSTESKDDVILVEDELERVGQEIVEDIPAYVREEMRVKFYKFHDNRRPPYYGTWRKKSSVVKPRNPFAQDKKFFDYEVDSDDEWEEEEPGESLEDGSDEDKDKESEDDEYEVDNEWFVPHGHLSEEELQNEDEFGMDDDNTREAQKVKLQILQQEFAQEMKKKTEKIKPRLIGCIWADINGNQPPECAKIIWDTLGKKAMLFTDPPLIEEPEADRSTESNSPSGATNGNTEKATDKLKPISLSENMVKDLTRLIHGNNHAKNFLINEYIAYVEKTEESVKNGGLRKPLKSVVRDKIDEIAEWQAVDASASSIQEIEQANDETNDKKKKKVKRRLCWVVKQEMLDKMDLSSLKLKNSWDYTLPPKFLNVDKIKTDDAATTLTSESISTSAVESAKGKNSETSKITKFAKVLTTEEKATKLQNSPLVTNTSSTDKSSTETKSNASSTSKEKKRVPLLMSVARGQQISTPAKNKLISQFLNQNNRNKVKPLSPTTSTRRSEAVTSPIVEDDDVVILD